MEREQNEHVSPVMWIVFLCIVLASVVSYLRYERNLDFDIVFSIECDPSVERCTTDEESYYTRYEARASDIDKYCTSGYYAECVETLSPLGLVSIIGCDENLQEWESCSEIGQSADDAGVTDNGDLNYTSDAEEAGETVENPSQESATVSE